MARLQADVEGEGEAVRSILDISAQGRLKQSKVLADIRTYAERVGKEIREMGARVLAEVDGFKDSALASFDEDMDVLARARRTEDERRDALQRAILVAQMETAAAVHENTEVNRQGFDSVNQSIAHQTGHLGQKMDGLGETMKGGLEQLNSTMQQGNAMQAALAKKQGYDLQDYNPVLQTGRAVRNLGTQVAGTLLGKSTMEIEGEKLKNG